MKTLRTWIEGNSPFSEGYLVGAAEGGEVLMFYLVIFSICRALCSPCSDTVGNNLELVPSPRR